MLTPQEKRKQTILKRYGSYANMMKTRDVGDLVLGGYNGGIKKNKKKGFGSRKKEELVRLAKSKQRDSRGRFIRGADRDKDKDTL